MSLTKLAAPVLAILIKFAAPILILSGLYFFSISHNRMVHSVNSLRSDIYHLEQLVAKQDSSTRALSSKVDTLNTIHPWRSAR